MHNTKVPFGMLFEELTTKCSPEVVIPCYDPVESISYIIDSTGKFVPYINWAWQTFGTQTGRITLIGDEDTDTDPGDDSPRYLTGTQTLTEVEDEITDKD